MTTKDFGRIETDYAFFMAHATEAKNDAAEYCRQLSGFPQGRKSLRLLDLGCGTGDFTQRLLQALDWPPEMLQLMLVEPVPHQREAAACRLAPFSRFAIETASALPSQAAPTYDLALSNHVLYYVDNLEATLQQMLRLVQPAGKLLLAMAGWENTLVRIWKSGFDLLERPVPYHVSEDVAAILTAQQIPFRKTGVGYRLCFTDTVENRTRILRFLFGEFLQQVPLQELLSEFDRDRQGDQILIETASDHYVIDV